MLFTAVVRPGANQQSLWTLDPALSTSFKAEASRTVECELLGFGGRSSCED